MEEHKQGNTTGVLSLCSTHKDKEAELFCETCEELICCKCALRGSKHHSHDYVELGKVCAKYRKEIQSVMSPMEEKLVVIGQAEKDLGLFCFDISSQQSDIESEVEQTARRLHAIIDKQHAELLSQLQQITTGKRTEVKVQVDQLKHTQTQFSDCIDTMRQHLKDEATVPMAMKAAIKQAKGLIADFNPDSLKPTIDADMTFSTRPSVWTECEKYGQLVVAGLPDPSLCFAQGDGLESAIVGGTSVITVFGINGHGKPCTKPIKSIECHVSSKFTHSKVKGRVEQKSNQCYKISYTPTVKGRHQISLKIQDQHIRGSPFHVVATLPVKKLATPILTIAGLKSPGGIAVNKRGEVIIAEKLKHCVSVFSPRGEKRHSFGTHGSGEGQFDYPCGVAVDNVGNILVADFNNRRIQKFTSSGAFLAAEVFQDSDPQLITDIAFESESDCVYVVGRSDSIYVLHSDLSFRGIFRKADGVDKQFSSSSGIACDRSGQVYVADSASTDIQVFSAEGEFSRAFERRGEGRGELGYPYPLGLAVDANGLVYVSEYHNHRVSVYSSEGVFVHSFGVGEEGEAAGKPCGLTVDHCGVVYVCDENNGCVYLY